MSGANHTALRVNLNGQSALLIVDTGAPLTVLDRQFYRGASSKTTTIKEADLPPGLQKKTEANGQPAEVGYIDSLKSGAMDFGKGPVIVTDLSGTVARYNNAHPQNIVAGLMGEDILHRYSAIIDWRRRGIYFNTDPSKRIKVGPALVAAGWTAVPMATGNGRHFFVSATVSGKPVRLLVDTGAQFTTFTEGVVPLNIIYNRDNGTSIGHLAATTMTLSMIGGDMSMHPARVEHWKLGSYEIVSASVAVARLPERLAKEQSDGDGPILGVAGAELLAANNAIIDVAGSTLYLKRK